MTEQRRHRLTGLFSVFVCAMMLTGLVILAPEGAEAYPDNAWIVGNVTDGANPVEGVYIKAMLFMGNGMDVNWTMTDVDGNYSMMVPGGLSYVVFAADGRFYMVMNSVTVSPSETKVSNFTLTPIVETADVTVSGYVTDELGNPRSDGHVLGIVNNPIGGDTPYYANVTTPDPITGYFEVNVIPGIRGGGAVGMDFVGYPMAENITEDPLVSGMSYTFDLELRPQSYNDDAMVYGFVTEVGTGLPLSSVVVSYESDDGMNRYSNWTLTNETGYYEMGVHTGDYFRMTFQKIGYTIKFYSPDILPFESVQQDAALRLADAKIRGNVTDEVTGDPITFCRVFLVDDPYMQENMTMAMTDSAGQYELDAFEGTGLYFGAEQDGYARNFTIINVTSGDELWYDLTLIPYSAWLVGQVTDALSGAPVADANVWLNGPIEESQSTDGMGMYNLSLVPGDYDVQVNYWMGGPSYKTYNDTVTILDGVENVLDVALIPWQNALVKGHVYDVISGDPVPFASIWLSGWWGNGTNSNETGDYELFNVDGDYTINVNAPSYQGYSQDLFLPELSVTVVDIGLMPQNPEPTALLHGYVSNSDDMSPVNGAEVRVRLEAGQYENSTMTAMSGYYEMYVPPWVLNVKVTAYEHAPFFGQINMSGVSDYALDIALDRDLFEPNMTYNQNPRENISWSNPSFTQVLIEEENLREMTLIRFMEWNSSGLDSNWTMVDWKRTTLDPWNPESGLSFSMDDGNYSVNEVWDGTVSGGWLSNGVDSSYLPASSWPWYMEPVYAVSGFYTNATSPRIDGAALFNASTGAFAAFVPNNMGYPNVFAPDPTGVFEPQCLVIEYDEGMIVDFSWRSLRVWDVNSLTFTFDNVAPSGNYKSEFYVNDWGNKGNWTIIDLTVDHESPTADAGPDQNVPTNSVVTLDGTASYDNVGVATYLWEFFNATGVWTALWGDIVTYSFESAGSYDINLTVWDGANHMSNDSLTVDVFTDLPPVADAGPDQSVDEDTIVTFDGSGSSDDYGVDNYTWFIWELSFEMYDEAPQYTFSDPGAYHVQLVVRDTIGQVSASDEMIVSVGDVTPPTADAGPDQLVLVMTLVTMNGSASTDNGAIVSYVWSFFDVMPVELYGMEVSYTFTTDGSYMVTLNVTDAGGNWATDALWVDVFTDLPPVADAGPDQSVNEDTLVTFDGSGSSDDNGIDNYTWTIIELSVVLYEIDPTYTFDDPGMYHVWLVVTDTVGQLSDPDEMIVTVDDVTPPIAEAGPDQRVNLGDIVTFNGSLSTDNGVIVNYTWSFTDIVYTEVYGEIATYTFSGYGWYWIDLTVWDAGGNGAMDGFWLYVNSPPTAGTSGDQWLYPGDSAYLGGWWCWDDWDWYYDLEYTWTFIYAGSEVVLVGNDPDVYYQFVIPGEYNVSLTVKDTDGLEDHAYMMVTVTMIPDAWWVDPRTNTSLVDGATISLGYVVLKGYTDQYEEVDIITPSGIYRTWGDDNGYFEVDHVNLSEGVNFVTILTYSDWWGMVVSLQKMIISDTHCMLWVESPESPTADLMVNIGGWTDAGATVTVNGVPAVVRPDGTFDADLVLSEGPNVVNVTATDSIGNENWAESVIELDTTPPSLVVTAPVDGANLSEANVLVYGTVDSGAVVRVNGVLADGTADWSATVSLVEGANTIVVIATDSVGNTATQIVVVNYVPPVYVTPEELAALRAELLGEIGNLSAALAENVSALQDQIDAAMGEITALQASLSENITALQGQIDIAMDEILALQTSLAENITALQAQIDAAMDEIAALQASVGENVTALQGQIDTAMAEIVGLQASLLENVTALQTEIVAAMADIVALESALTENVTALQDQINDAVLDISGLQAALAENVTALQSDIAALETQLQENVTALQQAIAANATALQQALAQNVTTLQSQIAALRADLQANVTSLTSAIAENVTDLQGLVSALDQDVADMQAELAAVNDTLVAAQDQIADAIDSIEAELVDFQQQINDLNESVQNDVNDVEDKASDTDSFASMLMYLTLILFAIAIVMVALVWYLSNKKFGKGGAGKSEESLEEVEGPSEVEKEFDSLEKEIKDEEL